MPCERWRMNRKKRERFEKIMLRQKDAANPAQLG
jgi:hypothetical protein